MVALSVERDSSKKSLAAQDAGFERPRVIVDATSYFVILLQYRLEQQKTSHENAKLALKTRMVETYV